MGRDIAPILGATSPLYWARHRPYIGLINEVRISIHAPRMGRDKSFSTSCRGLPYFNPRAPYGARLLVATTAIHTKYFNPRAPYGARRLDEAVKAWGAYNFNPRAPYGARLREW